MKKTLNFVELHSKKFELAAGVVTIISSVVAFLKHLASIKILLAVICLGAFFFIRYALSRKNEGLPLSKTAKILNGLNYLLIPISIVIFSQWLITRNEPSCDKISSAPVVCVSRFSQNADDDFSYALVSDLSQILAAQDSIHLASIDTFINQKVFENIKSLEEIIRSECHERGLVVLGKFSAETELFDCSIYVSELLESEYAQKQLANNQLLRLKDPETISFSIKKQTKLVTDFILILLNYYKHENEACIHSIRQLLVNEGASLSPSIQELLLIYMSNSLADSGDLLGGKEGYETLLEADSLSSIANYNYGMLWLSEGDSLTASKYLKRAHTSNRSYLNPIQDWEPATESNTIGLEDNFYDESPKASDTTKLKQEVIIEERKKEIGSELMYERELGLDMLPKNCIIQRVGDSKFALYDRQFKKVGVYDKIWRVESREINSLEKRLNTRFFYVRKDGHFGLIDDNGEIVVKPVMDDLKSLDRAFLGLLGR
jgi:hypothetical protein